MGITGEYTKIIYNLSEFSRIEYDVLEILIIIICFF